MKTFFLYIGAAFGLSSCVVNLGTPGCDRLSGGSYGRGNVCAAPGCMAPRSYRMPMQYRPSFAYQQPCQPQMQQRIWLQSQRQCVRQRPVYMQRPQFNNGCQPVNNGYVNYGYGGFGGQGVDPGRANIRY